MDAEVAALSPVWVAVPLAVTAAGLILVVVAAVRLVARERLLAARFLPLDQDDEHAVE